MLFRSIKLITVIKQLSESDAEGWIRVYRRIDDGRKPDLFLDEFSPADFLAQKFNGIRETWGGGDYRIRVFNAKGQLVGNRRVPMADLPASRRGMSICGRSSSPVRRSASFPAGLRASRSGPARWW